MKKTMPSMSPEQIDARYGFDPIITERVDGAIDQRAQWVKNLAGIAILKSGLLNTAIDEVYERFVQYEQKVAPRLKLDDYGEGTALDDDELIVKNGSGPLAASADHATDPIRKTSGVREGADHGTAALAFALHDDYQASIVLPRGRQTGNANVDVMHPLKSSLNDLLPGKKGFLSIHGMRPGKFEHQFDPTEIHAVLGLGAEPTEVSQKAARDIIEQVKEEHGLKVVVGNSARFFDRGDTPRLERDDEGNLKYAPRLAAMGTGSTTNFVNNVTADSQMPALQVELSRSLRLLPEDMEYRDPRVRRLAVYMGYQLLKSISDGILKL